MTFGRKYSIIQIGNVNIFSYTQSFKLVVYQLVVSVREYFLLTSLTIREYFLFVNTFSRLFSRVERRIL
nr:MAG TPA: hypothetical protein [Caudoviricetes sp.]